MKQAVDLDGNVISNAVSYLDQPIILATGTASTAFLKDSLVVITARTAECFFRISTAGTAASTSDHSLPVGASRVIPLRAGQRIANTGGELRVSVTGFPNQSRGDYY